METDGRWVSGDQERSVVLRVDVACSGVLSGDVLSAAALRTFDRSTAAGTADLARRYPSELG